MGDGAFSNVYKAIERKTGRKVAVKVVRKYELNSSQVSVAFQANIFFFFLLLLPCATSHTLAKCGVQGGRWDCSDNICSESTLTNTDRRSERQQTPQQGLQEEGTARYRGLFFLFSCTTSSCHSCPRSLALERRGVSHAPASDGLALHCHILSSWIKADRSARQHPQRGPDHARDRSPRCRQASQLLRVGRALLPHS